MCCNSNRSVQGVGECSWRFALHLTQDNTYVYVLNVVTYCSGIYGVCSNYLLRTTSLKYTRNEWNSIIIKRIEWNFSPVPEKWYWKYVAINPFWAATLCDMTSFVQQLSEFINKFFRWPPCKSRKRIRALYNTSMKILYCLKLTYTLNKIRIVVLGKWYFCNAVLS